MILLIIVGERINLLDKCFHDLLVKLSKSFNSSPYFLRCYDDLCLKYRSEGCRNAVLIGLRQILGDQISCSGIFGGYVLGDITLSRNSLAANIYFIFICNEWRGCGNGAKLYRYFEDTVRERSASVGVKLVIEIRITIKHCIVNSIQFWRKLGFEGSEESICLIKIIK